MAVDLAPKGINVNSIAPGVHTTEMTGAIVDNATQSVKAVPDGRYEIICDHTSARCGRGPACCRTWLGAWLGAW